MYPRNWTKDTFNSRILDSEDTRHPKNWTVIFAELNQMYNTVQKWGPYHEREAVYRRRITDFTKESLYKISHSLELIHIKGIQGRIPKTLSER